MRPILALNCLLQIEQKRSEEEGSFGYALALAFRCARFLLVYKYIYVYLEVKISCVKTYNIYI